MAKIERLLPAIEKAAAAFVQALKTFAAAS
jgi:hypothetical protein